MNAFEYALKNNSIRLSNGDKWMVWDETILQWVVFQCKAYQKKTRVIKQTDHEEIAINVLLD